MTNKLKGELCN